MSNQCTVYLKLIIKSYRMVKEKGQSKNWIEGICTSKDMETIPSRKPRLLYLLYKAASSFYLSDSKKGDQSENNCSLLATSRF